MARLFTETPPLSLKEPRWVVAMVEQLPRCQANARGGCLACEHAFVSTKGSPYARFQRSLQTRKLSVVLRAATELQAIQLDDALEILVLMAHERDPRFDTAAARWVGLLLTETPPMGLQDARFALTLVERLPDCAETLRRLARRP